MALTETTRKLREEYRKGMVELGLYRDKKPSNPALDPNALYVKSDGPGESLEALAVGLYYSVMKLKEKSNQLYYFALLQMENGLRTAELIGVKSTLITVTGSFKVKGKKGSNDRMISPGEAKDYLLKCRKVGRDPFKELDRFFLRREYKKVGINYYFEGDKKAKITHVFRHLHVSGMLHSGITVEEASKFIGHKNVKSTESYGKIK